MPYRKTKTTAETNTKRQGKTHTKNQGDLLTVLSISGLPSEKNAFLFNGDFVDRGKNSTECILLLLLLKLYVVFLLQFAACYLFPC